MAKNNIVIFSLAALSVMGIAGFVFAQGETIAPEETITIKDLGVSEPKILPSNPFYFFKELGRDLRGFAAFNPVSKAELELKFTNEKAAEVKKISETQPQNTEAIQRALENYQESQENLRSRFEKLTETSQNPKMNNLLNNLTEKVVKHEKLFDEIAFRSEGKEGVLNTINDAKTGSENLMGEASKKDDPSKFSSRLEKVLLEERGGDLKHARSVEIIDNFGAKAAPQVKEALQRLRAEFSEKLEQDIENLMNKEGENAVKEKIARTPGDVGARSLIIEEIQKRAEERVSQVLEMAMGQIEAVLRKEMDIARKAKEQIERAEKMLQETERTVSAVPKTPQVVSVLMAESRDNLNNAKMALAEEKYGEAFGQARSAEVLARNALKFFGEEKPETENLKNQLKELEEKIRLYEKLINERELTQEQIENAREILNNNAVMQLEQAKESLANGELEKTKMYIDYIRRTFLKLSNILENKTTSIAPQPQQIPVMRAVPVPMTVPAVPCEDIQRRITELKELFAANKINEADFRAKYDSRLRDLIVCQEGKNPILIAPLPPVSVTPVPVPPTQTACTMEYNPVCGSDNKTYSNSCIAKSAGVGVLYNGECREVASVFIAVISPSAGDSWLIGSQQKIRWESKGIPSDYLIMTVRLRDSQNVEHNLLTNTPNDGFEEITVPTTLSAGLYSLEIKTIYGGTTLMAKGAQFNITVPAGASLRLLSPNGGEQWTIGKTYTVKWENPGNVKSIYVDLYKGDNYLAGLGGLGYNYGAPTSWTWNTIDTPNFEAGSDLKLRIRSDLDKTIYDESDNYFSISAPAISPATCDVLKANSAYNYYFDSCKKGGFDGACFNKYYSTYQGCNRSVEGNQCTASNMNADKNMLCDTGLIYTCSDSERTKNYNVQGTATDKGTTYADYCVDTSVLKEYSCYYSEASPTGVLSEESYACSSGCENGVCKSLEKPVPAVLEQPTGLKNLENKLADISEAFLGLLGKINPF